jgi:KipI family sensor histidine kinase inhibitor
MSTRVLPAGDRGLLVEVDDLDTVLALADRLRAADLAGVQDIVPASRTVLVRTGPGPDLNRLGSEILDLAGDLSVDAATNAPAAILDVRVRYDGPDLDEVAAVTGLTRAEVVAAHTGQPWRAAFAGFAPGFCYLTGGDARLDVPRRHESRTSVPAGSVALAGGFSAVYPRESPGGWQLIGTTEAVMWDVDRQPPALISAGAWVRFVDVTATEANATADLNDNAASRHVAVGAGSNS